MTDTMEHRVVNETTGGEKGSKLARFDLVPPRSLKALAEHFGKACIEHGGKYEARNWQKGTNWSLNYAAAMRHFTQWWSGEDLDEDGNSHLAACMWHACVLIEFAATHPELDDRPSAPEPEEEPLDFTGLLGQKVDDAYRESYRRLRHDLLFGARSDTSNARGAYNGIVASLLRRPAPLEGWIFKDAGGARGQILSERTYKFDWIDTTHHETIEAPEWRDQVTWADYRADLPA